LKGGDDAVDKFAGVGLKNLIVIALFTMFFIVMCKVAINKHPIKGLSDFVNAI
jgi:hypothetical protein